MTNITPGPWKLIDDDLVTGLKDEAAHTDHIAHVARRADRLANARAISLVPEMIEALEKLIVTHPVTCKPQHEPEWNFYRPIFDKVRAILKQIEG